MSRTLSLNLLVLAGASLAFVGCTSPKTDTATPTNGDADTDADADADGDTDTDTDSDTTPDTGLGFYYWSAGVNSPGGVFADSWFGVAAYGSVDGDWACEATSPGILDDTPADGPGCDACDYEFTFETDATEYVGPWCDGTGLSGVDWSGYHLGLGWGPSEYYSEAYGHTYGDPMYLYYMGSWGLFGYSTFDGGTYYAYTSIGEDGAYLIRPYVVSGSSGYYWLYGYYGRY